MPDHNNEESSIESGMFPGAATLDRGSPSSFSTLQFLVSSEIAGILLLEDQRKTGKVQKQCQIDSIANVARLAATAVRRQPLSKELEHKYIQLVYSLVNIVDACDSHTTRHGPRTGRIAHKIAQTLGFSPEECDTIQIAGILHDIGKIGIPERILTKSGKLTVQEWKSMKNHPVLGAQILAPISGFTIIAKIVEGHHEKFDGSGYPFGLRKDDIPIGARILAVADAFTTMTDGRIYRHIFSQDEAVLELKRCNGTHFDPLVVTAALDSITGDFWQRSG
jgi:putative nucleotidyltransferase with HDIG domain